MGEAFTRANKYVLTRGDQPLEWANSHRLKSIDDVAALKQGDGPNLIIQGASTIYPGLFGDGTPTTMLKMVDHKVTAKGTVIATYEPGGTLPAFPPFGPQPSTSSREAQRLRRMAEGSW